MTLEVVKATLRGSTSPGGVAPAPPARVEILNGASPGRRSPAAGNHLKLNGYGVVKPSDGGKLAVLTAFSTH